MHFYPYIPRAVETTCIKYGEMCGKLVNVVDRTVHLCMHIISYWTTIFSFYMCVDLGNSYSFLSFVISCIVATFSHMHFSSINFNHLFHRVSSQLFFLKEILIFHFLSILFYILGFVKKNVIGFNGGDYFWFSGLFHVYFSRNTEVGFELAPCCYMHS